MLYRMAENYFSVFIILWLHRSLLSRKQIHPFPNQRVMVTLLPEEFLTLNRIRQVFLKKFLMK